MIYVQLRTLTVDILQIAATGIKPPSAQQNPRPHDNSLKTDITSSPRDGANTVSHSNGSNQPAFTPNQKRLVPLAPKDSKETGSGGTIGPQVHVQGVDSVTPPGRTPRALDGMLMPTTSDEAGTQVSSSSGSGKPPSLDGKSVTSGTTFALDEKESLRPDDSASVKATEDEDIYSHLSSGLPGSRTGSDDGVQAFRDQLREISSIQPPRQTGPVQGFDQQGNPPQGVLYVPPQGLGVGTVPGSVHAPSGNNQIVDSVPDPKLLEALESPKDRIMVLKLEQDIVDFVKDPKESSLKLPQTHAFYRMLAHKLADYYQLGHIVDESTMAVRIYKTPTCRLPPPLTGIATPSTAASTPPPMGHQMKILRRGADNAGHGPAIVNGSNLPSKTTSENGESGNDDDKRPKPPASREEREARYEAARKRIMGSAKPSESPEEYFDMDDSRSSSAAGKKTTKKKPRSDSDDDFEARSAYSAYYTTPFSPAGPAPTSYGFPSAVESQSNQFSPHPFGGQGTAGSYQPSSGSSNAPWPSQPYHTQSGSPSWVQHQHPGYELSTDFQRAMNFQPAPMAMQSSNVQPGFNAAYGQQFSASQQTWQQQSSYVGGYPSQAGPDYGHGYPNRPPSAPNQTQDGQPYAYGQLPSQTFPGRLLGKLEHPLPGSYKGKHFNPQSQTFIPGQTNGTSLRPFTPQAPPVNTVTFGAPKAMPSPLQRQGSARSQNSGFASSHPPSFGLGGAYGSIQPMTHPLPQPVFPRQPSPNVPLPPKPEITPPKPADKAGYFLPTAASASMTHSQSSIAKWGAPASLPAKPPPSAEPFDPARFVQPPRQPLHGSARPANVMPSFGSMPPMAGGLGMNGQGLQSQRRA